MLLEDEGWDLDLLSNKNKAYQRLKKLRPYSLRKLRRLRRLRRLRLMSINLYLHRSNANAVKTNKNIYAPMSQITKGPELVTKTASAAGVEAGRTPLTKLTGLTRTTFAFPKNARLQNGHNQVKQVADLEFQARNHSNIYKVSCDLIQSQPLTPTSATLVDQVDLLSVNLYKRFNNKYLIKHNDNKLKFIIN
jgi:hypothetical protein